MIIDFHTHTFPLKVAEKTLPVLGKAAGCVPYTNGTEEGLLCSMKEGGIDYSVTLPVMTNPGQVEKLNSAIVKNREDGFAKGLIHFGGLHPDYVDYKEELKRLKREGIKGIKLHPAYQATDIGDIRMMRILDAASEQNLIVLIHAGLDNGIPGHNYAPVSQILQVIKEVQPVKFVLGHMGGWAGWDEVEKYLAGAPVWFDTAYSLIPKQYHPDWMDTPHYKYNLSDEGFIRISRKHGMDKILFATDSPWQKQNEIVDTVNRMALTAEERENIFCKNALKLLGL